MHDLLLTYCIISANENLLEELVEGCSFTLCIYISTDGWVRMLFPSCIILSQHLHSTVYEKVLVLCVCFIVWLLFTVAVDLCVAPHPSLWKEQAKGHRLPHVRMLQLKQCSSIRSVSCPPGGFLWAASHLWLHARPRQYNPLRDEIRLDYRVIISDTSHAWKAFVLKDPCFRGPV